MSNTPEREIEHKLDSDTKNLLATLDEQKENVLQMSELRRRTVEPGVMKLNVSQVTTTEDSPSWAIDIEHPVEGEFRIHKSKPTKGWTNENELVQALEWYDAKNPYYLQLTDLYMKHVGDDGEYQHGWELTSPPDYSPPWRDRVASEWEDLKGGVYRPSMTGAGMYVILTIAILIAPIFYGPLSLLGPVAGASLTNMLVFGAMTIFGLMVMDG